jgi:hypothetical protein
MDHNQESVYDKYAVKSQVASDPARARYKTVRSAKRPKPFHAQNVIDTLFFDAGDLQVAFQFFCGVTVGDLATKGAQNTANSRTLTGLKRVCNIPAAN